MFELLPHWFVLMADVSLKALLLAGVTGLLLAGSRIRNSSLKHAAWLGVLSSLIGLPLLSSVIPAISDSVFPSERTARVRPGTSFAHGIGRDGPPRRQNLWRSWMGMPFDARRFRVAT